MSDDKDLISFKDEFAEKITPKEIKSGDELFLFKCPCGSMHFRHAGYVEMMMPFIRADKTKQVANDSYPVKLCVSCKKAFIWADSQVYDVTNQIDLEAWEKTEKEAYKCTGPGGEC